MGVGHGCKLDRRREAALAALLTEPTIERAAAKAGVAYRTLKTWLATPEFQQAFKDARRTVLQETVSQLLSGCSDAVATLRRNLSCGVPAAENRAAVALLVYALKGLEAEGLGNEVAELRQRLEKVQNDADLFQRIESYIPQLRKLNANGDGHEPGVPPGGLRGVGLAERMASREADGASGGVPVS
jgi:hypothetical protein